MLQKVLDKILFADDTNFLCINKSLLQLSCSVNEELENINLWFQINKMSLNTAKSNCILFGKNANKSLSLYIDDKVIQRVSDTKFLGVIIDENLSWKKQIDHVEKKISRGLGILHKLRDLLDSKSLCMLYYSLIYPYLSYCCQSWGNTYKKRVKRIVSLQKRAVRIIGGLQYRDHTNDMFVKLSILKFEDIVKVESAIFAYKGSRELLPNRLQKRYIPRIQTSSQYKTRNNKIFYENMYKKNYKLMCPSVKGIKTFNDLPDSIINSTSVKSFKYQLKKYIINTYNC